MAFVDHSGEKYNRWNIISPTDQYTKYKSRLWKCVCDCQLCKPESEREYHIMRINNILNGASKSCGCWKQESAANSHWNRYENNYELSEKGYVIGTIRDGYQFFIDEDDLDLVKPYCWHKNRGGYLRTLYDSYVDNLGKRHNKYIFMHNLIAEAHGYDCTLCIDHINGIRYDNRKQNLRTATRAQNTENAKKYATNKSGYKGVFYRAKWDRWEASITVNSKRLHLGVFKNYEDAILARKAAEGKYFGQFNRAEANLSNGLLNCMEQGEVK